MEEKRIPLSLKVSPALKGSLERYALREKRSLNNLAEVLLEWAVGQLEIAGDSLRLLDEEGAHFTKADAKAIGRRKNRTDN